MIPNTIICGDNLTILRTWPDERVNCCVTSLPYWGLRDYGVEGQLGLEKTPEEYTAKMVEIFREVKRVLKDDGTLWLNLGDSYSLGASGTRDQERWPKQSRNNGGRTNMNRLNAGMKPKDLVGIPWMVAFALRADGWYLRQDIIWSKPNPMPESVTDRCTKAHEYIFLMSKSAKYYYDGEAIKEPVANGTTERMLRGVSDHHKNVNGAPGQTPHSMNQPRQHKTAITPGQSPQGKALKRMSGLKDPDYQNRNKRSVWTVTTKPYKGAHFATFPQDLILPMILAGCPKGGVVLDPFMGSGTTAYVAREQGRKYIGIELNPKYIELAEKRLEQGVLF